MILEAHLILFCLLVCEGMEKGVRGGGGVLGVQGWGGGGGGGGGGGRGSIFIGVFISLINRLLCIFW